MEFWPDMPRSSDPCRPPRLQDVRAPTERGRGAAWRPSFVGSDRSCLSCPACRSCSSEMRVDSEDDVREAAVRRQLEERSRADVDLLVVVPVQRTEGRGTKSLA